MELYRQKYREYIDKILQSIDPSDQAAVEAAFSRLRESNEQMIAKNDDWEATGRAQLMRDALEDVIREQFAAEGEDLAEAPEEDFTEQPYEVLSGDAPLSAQQSEPAATAYASAGKAERPRSFLTGLATGLGIAAIAAVLMIATGLAGLNFGAQAERAALFEREYQDMLPLLDEAVPYLRTVEEDVKRRQADDPDALTEAVGRRFVSLRNLNRELYNQMPDSMPRGSDVLVRADADAYKVLFTWPLCRVAAIARPELVDPRRKGDGLHCTHIGFWNEAGTSF